MKTEKESEANKNGMANTWHQTNGQPRKKGFKMDGNKKKRSNNKARAKQTFKTNQKKGLKFLTRSLIATISTTFRISAPTGTNTNSGPSCNNTTIYFSIASACLSFRHSYHLPAFRSFLNPTAGGSFQSHEIATTNDLYKGDGTK